VTIYDALVIGAGPAGATAAIRLARLGLSVGLVEKAAFPRRKVCGEYISATTWPLLAELGVAGGFDERAGPEVRRVGLFAGDAAIAAPMPAPPRAQPWGRAVGREWLDTALRDAAVREGAQLWQPWRVSDWSKGPEGYVVKIAAHGEARELHSRILIAAHGSWERQAWNGEREPARDCDLLGFKAHFHGAALPAGLMPLVLFPGGYGGMVHGDRGRVSFSCCIRRDALRRCRAGNPRLGAGEAVIAHVSASCRGVREALAASRCESAWLSAGPIRPGIRSLAADGVFAVGNAAGEAHPLVAEGISMAIQSAWLLGEQLADRDTLSEGAVETARAAYAASWRRHFATRVRAASIFAALTMSPGGAAASAALLARTPALLTWGAWWSGKAHVLAAEPA